MRGIWTLDYKLCENFREILLDMAEEIIEEVNEREDEKIFPNINLDEIITFNECIKALKSLEKYTKERAIK